MFSNSESPVSSQAAVEESSDPTIPVVRARNGYQIPTVRRTELILEPTGPFRTLIERYITDVAPGKYIPGDLLKVRGDIARFFRFVVLDLHIEDLDEIRPSTITQYIRKQRTDGISTFLFLGRLATFFVWVISLGVYDHGNPVVNRLHRPMMSAPRSTSNSTL